MTNTPSQALVDVERLREALTSIRSSMALLQLNSEGCAATHYGNDGALYGTPGWLLDTRADLDRLTALLSTPSLQTGGEGADGLIHALERLIALTPHRANAADAQDLHISVRAIAESAIERFRTSGVEGETVPGDEWVMAPKKPSKAMVKAGARARCNGSISTALSVWSAMLAAAHEPRMRSATERLRIARAILVQHSSLPPEDVEDGAYDESNIMRCVLAALTASPKQAPVDQGEVERLRHHLHAALDHYERNICHHDSTHRGGFLWTICDDCGAKWADDEGGFKPFSYPREIEAAYAALSSPVEGEER